MLQDGVLLHASPESRLPHWPGGQGHKPSQTAPPPDKVPPAFGQSVHHSDPHWPRLAGSGCAGSPPGPFLPTLSLLSARSGTFPPGAVSGFLAPGPGSRDRLLSSHWVSFPRGPARPPVGPPPSHSPSPQCPALCLDQLVRVVWPCRRRRRDAGLVSRAARSGSVFTSLGPTVGLGKWWGRGKSLPSPPPPRGAG